MTLNWFKPPSEPVQQESVLVCSCTECGGAGICQHGRQRNQCKDCGGRGSVSMGGCAIGARSAEGRASVSISGSALNARSMEGRACMYSLPLYPLPLYPLPLYPLVLPLYSRRFCALGRDLECVKAFGGSFCVHGRIRYGNVSHHKRRLWPSRGRGGLDDRKSCQK